MSKEEFILKKKSKKKDKKKKIKKIKTSKNLKRDSVIKSELLDATNLEQISHQVVKLNENQKLVLSKQKSANKKKNNKTQKKNKPKIKEKKVEKPKKEKKKRFKKRLKKSTIILKKPKFKREQIELMEKAINELGEDIKLIFVGLFNTYKITGITAIERDNHYKEKDLLEDLEKYMKEKFPKIIPDEIYSLWEKYKIIIEKNCDWCNPLMGFTYDGDFGYYEQEKNIYKIHKKKIEKEILDRINSLGNTKKYAIFLFLIKFRPYFSSIIYEKKDEYLSILNMFFQFLFDMDFKGDFSRLLVLTGLLFGSTWITTGKNWNNKGFLYCYPKYLEELAPIIIEELSLKNEIKDFSQELKEFREKFDISNDLENTLEFVAIEYLLHNPESLESFLNKIKWKGVEYFYEWPKIVENYKINPFITNELDSLIDKIKKQLFKKFDWFIHYLLKLSRFDRYKKIKFGIEIPVEVRKKPYFIKIYPWYNEDIIYSLKNEKRNTILIFLYHPKINFLRDNFCDNKIMSGLITFRNNEKAKFIDLNNLPKEFIEELSLEFIKHGYTLTERKIKKKRIIPNILTISESKKKLVETKEKIKFRSSLETQPSNLINKSKLKTIIVEEPEPPESSGNTFNDDIFGYFFKTENSGFPKTITSEDPYLILLGTKKGRKYIDTITILLKKIYRNIAGGKPDPDNFYKADRIKDYDLKAEGRLININEKLVKNENFVFPKNPNKIKIDTIKKKWFLEELELNYSQNIGFILLELPDNIIKDAYKEIRKKALKIKPSQIIILQPKETELDFNKVKLRPETDILNDNEQDQYNLKNMLKRLAIALHLFLKPEKDSRWKNGETLDDFFFICRDKMDDYQKKIDKRQTIKVKGDEVSIERLVKPSCSKKLGEESKETESSLHYFLKTLIVKYLYEEEGYKREMIKTEDDTEIAKKTDKKIIPDIELFEKKEVFEIETLYGSSRPLSKINKTVEKYEKREKGQHKNFKINVILMNYDVFLYFKYLKKLEKDLQDDGFNVEFKTIDLSDNKIKLIGLTKFKNKIQKSNIN